MLEELCLSEMGEAPLEIKLWHSEEGFAEFIVKFEQRVAIITVSVYDIEEEELGFMLEQTMYINASEYLPESITTQSINSEQVLIKVGDQDIYLTDSGRDVVEIIDIIEAWTRELSTGEASRFSESMRSRVASLRRERQAIISKLEHLDMGRFSEQIDTLSTLLASTEALLADGETGEQESL